MFYCQGENTASRKENEKNTSIFLKSIYLMVSAPHGNDGVLLRQRKEIYPEVPQLAVKLEH